MSDKKIRVGYVAVGRQAQEHRIPAGLVLADEGLVEIAAVADVDLGAAARVAQLFGRPGAFGPIHEREAGERVSYPTIMGRSFPVPQVYRSIADMARGEAAYGGIDLFVISSPHHVHEEHVLEALQYGHVVVEKPMATGIAGARRMRAEARRLGRLLLVGYQYAYGTAGKAFDWVRSGVAGALQSVDGNWHRDRYIPEDAAYRVRGTGVAIDLIGHIASAALPLIDSKPVAFEAQGWNANGRLVYGDEFEAAERVEATVWFANGVRLNLRPSWVDNAPPEESLGFVAKLEHGRLDNPLLARELDPSTAPVRRSRRDGDTLIEEDDLLPVLYTEAVIAQLRDIVDAIATGRMTLRFTADHAVAVEEIVHGVLAALELPPGTVYRPAD